MGDGRIKVQISGERESKRHRRVVAERVTPGSNSGAEAGLPGTKGSIRLRNFGARGFTLHHSLARWNGIETRDARAL